MKRLSDEQLAIAAFIAAVICLSMLLTGCGRRAPSFAEDAPEPRPVPTAGATPEPGPHPTILPIEEPAPTPRPTTAPGSATRTVLLRNTYYYIAEEADYSGLARDDVLLRRDGSVIKAVAARFRRDADIEGTLMLEDGTVWNYAGVVGGRARYARTVHPWGRGVGDCALEPFRTIAVDPREVPFGSLVRVTEFIGMRLPDGTIHDGFARANDAGGAIKGDRMDIFTGVRRYAPLVARAGINHLEALEVKVYGNVARDPCVKEAAR